MMLLDRSTYDFRRYKSCTFRPSLVRIGLDWIGLDYVEGRNGYPLPIVSKFKVEDGLVKETSHFQSYQGGRNKFSSRLIYLLPLA